MVWAPALIDSFALTGQIAAWIEDATAVHVVVKEPIESGAFVGASMVMILFSEPILKIHPTVLKMPAVF